MRSDNGSHDRYRRDEAALAEQLDEGRRAAEDAAERERTRQRFRELGVLEKLKSALRAQHRAWITQERNRGRSLRAARLYADGMVERVETYQMMALARPTRWVGARCSASGTAIRALADCTPHHFCRT